jgi:1,4-dihydroxy-2-naphthoate octaprenyltransferase
VSQSALIEPTPANHAHPVKRYVGATRPAFLTITLAGCLLGWATVPFSVLLADFNLAFMTLVLALLAHAGVNVFNDFYDHLNGTDAANTQRLFPFTGGSRFIQNGVFSPRQTLMYAVTLFAAVIAGGLWLIAQAGIGLFWIGLAGLFIGWAYSAPPLKLNSRGLGELCVVVGFLLIVVGSAYVLKGGTMPLAWAAGLPYALLVMNILYINQFPDRAADQLAGKWHWVARLPPASAAKGYVLILVLSVVALCSGVLMDVLPIWALASLLGVVPALKAARLLTCHAAEPAHLGPAIGMTILAAHLQALLLAGILWGTTP